MKRNLNAQLAEQRELLYKNGLDLMYFMRGALSRADMLDLTPYEREIFSRYINERLEAEFKKKGVNLVY